MSNDLVEHIHLRLREEIERCGLSLAAASRAAAEAGPQRLKDIIAGRQKCPVDLLARLAPSGVDLIYVLTGERWSSNRPAPTALLSDEEILLESYRGMALPEKKRLLSSLLAGGALPAGDGFSVQGNNNRTAGRDYKEKT